MAQFAVVKKPSLPLPAGYHLGLSKSAPVSMDMTGAAQRAMRQMASMRPLGAAPRWASTLVRAGWALAVELPMLAVLLLWCRAYDVPPRPRRPRRVRRPARRSCGDACL